MHGVALQGMRWVRGGGNGGAGSREFWLGGRDQVGVRVLKCVCCSGVVVSVGGRVLNGVFVGQRWGQVGGRVLNGVCVLVTQGR